MVLVTWCLLCGVSLVGVWRWRSIGFVLRWRARCVFFVCCILVDVLVVIVVCCVSCVIWCWEFVMCWRILLFAVRCLFLLSVVRCVLFVVAGRALLLVG